MRLPITAYVSISHRLSGVFLFAVSGVLVWALDASLRSEEGFAMVVSAMGSVPVKALIWLMATALTYHSLAGVKHLIMDLGFGETMAGGVLGARLVIALAAVGAAGWGVVLW
jgi:succinate dehydrogenase / fumarate reductase cytochrome b subunit